MLKLTVKYLTNVVEGDVIGGYYVPDAPTTKVQTVAVALPVKRVEGGRADDSGQIRFYYGSGFYSEWFAVDSRKALVIER